MTEQESPILMVEEYWANTYFSVARYYGGINWNKQVYKIVNKHGVTLFELSDPSSNHYVGDRKAIEPGEPADLVLESWIPIYKALGREAFIEYIKNHDDLKEAKKYIKEIKKKK